MRGLVLVVTLAGLASAQEVPVTPDRPAPEQDLDAFADDVADALGLEGVDGWEERLEAGVERAWLAGRPDEPGVEDLDAPRAPATVGLTVRSGGLVITRLVAPDVERARAIAARLLDGFAPPLGAGPAGAPIARLPRLVEVRGAQVLLVRGPAVLDLPRALGARRAAWDAAGLPVPAAPGQGVALIDEDLEVLAWTGGATAGDPVQARLRRLDRTETLRALSVARDATGRGVGLRATVERAAEGHRLATGLATALQLDLTLPVPEHAGD